MERVEVDGLGVAYRRAGRGPALVLLHGAPLDSEVWREQLDTLADEFTVVAWDAPGFGGSDDPPGDFSLADYADCLAGFVAGLGLERPHVLGHSFGGGLALQLATRHPGLPRSLVVAAGYAGWAGSLPAGEVETRLRLARQLAGQVPRRFERDTLPGLVSPRTSAEKVDELLAVLSASRPAGVRVAAECFAAADLRPDLAGIDAPTLLLYGDADVRAPLPVAEALLAGLPNATLVTLAGAGHMLFLDAPAEFDAEVRRFLRTAG